MNNLIKKGAIFMEPKKMPFEDYNIMLKRIDEFKVVHNRNPNFYSYDKMGITIPEESYKDMIQRVKVYTEKEAHAPNTVEIKAYSPISPNIIDNKTALHKAAESAIGGPFSNLTGFYNLVKANEKYDYYLGDEKTQKQIINSLQKGTGANCIDYAQLGVSIAKDLNKGYTTRYVRTYCVKDKVGHHYFQVKGGEFGSNWVTVDLAAAASKSKYPIGKAWCENYGDKQYNVIRDE
jgi:hypothetical protein